MTIDEIRSALKSIDDLTNMQKGLYPLLLKYIEEYNRQGHGDELSLPFYSGLPATVKKPVIMLIGQESRNSGRFNKDLWGKWTIVQDADWRDWEIQTEWVNAYTEYQLTADEKRKQAIHQLFPTITPNNGPFWTFIRALCGKEYYPFYTNVDKVHRYVLNGKQDFAKDSYITEPLTDAIEKEIYDKYTKEGYILKKEIEIVQKNAQLVGIVFITGPNYDDSMRYALGIDEPIGNKPYHNKSNPIVDDICQKIEGEHILKELQDTPVFWTYHPNYLSKSGLKGQGIWEEIIKKIKESIRKKRL